MNIRQAIHNFFIYNDNGETAPLTQWEAHKCVLRGKFIALKTLWKKAYQARITNLIQKIKTLELAHKQTQAQQTYQELTQTREYLLTELSHKTKRKFILQQKLFYEFGNKSGKYLVRAIQKNKARSNSHTINDSQGRSKVTAPDIASQFEAYCSTLYNLDTQADGPSNNNTRQSLIKNFLKEHCPKPIDREDARQLEHPISEDELKNAIKQLKAGKSPGPDGFTAVYFKTFTEALTGPFLKAFNSLSSSTLPFHRLLKAHITVIPKEGKDTTLVTNYRPISLLNVDIKLFAKILANRLLPLLPSLIDKDQVGFIQGREARDNTIKAINLHHWMTTTKHKGFFLSLDAEKAFDRLAWDYMGAVLRRLGLQNHMFNSIMSLYTTPTARVRINGHLSNAFSITNGTRQGCPLSPILFVLTLEPLLNCLRKNENIKGIHIAGCTYKLAAFADDILLSLSEPHTSIPNLLNDFHLFQRLSNFKINFTKSHALNVTIPQETVTQCETNFPFQWRHDAIKYLGIYLTANLSDLFAQNYLPILKAICDDLKNWNKPQFSWFGRVAIVKMNILPRILYILQAIPIKLPPSFFLSYRRLCTDFLWKQKHPRIEYDFLT